MGMDDLFSVAVQQGPFTVLTVCTGNICRSPFAEVLLREQLTGLPVSVRSAGTHAMVGHPMTESMQRRAEASGVSDAALHVASRLTVEDLAAADLVLALTREHRKFIAELSPSVIRKTFTLRELGRLITHVPIDLHSITEADPGARMRAALLELARERGTLPPLEDPGVDDVIDPYQRADDVYDESVAEMTPAISSIASLLRQAANTEAA